MSAHTASHPDSRLAARLALRDQLLEVYGGGGSRASAIWRRARLAWKRGSWVAAVSGARVLKRSLDVFVSLAAALALSPLFLVVAFLVHRHDGGPVLFWQRRVGLWGREFDFPKFRSMRVDAEALRESLRDRNDHGDGVTFKIKRDPRITPVGRVIRKLSIDELPQFWCVLNGEMSLVGPRPPLPREVALYTLADRRRLDVKPGLTCIWQARGRGDVAFPEQVRLDVQYVQSRSFWLDIRLILETIPAVLTGRGAY